MLSIIEMQPELHNHIITAFQKIYCSVQISSRWTHLINAKNICSISIPHNWTILIIALLWLDTMGSVFSGGSSPCHLNKVAFLLSVIWCSLTSPSYGDQSSEFFMHCKDISYIFRGFLKICSILLWKERVLKLV